MLFFILVFLVITAVILIEELILERIYFPDTRGSRFPGVIFTLSQVLPVIIILSGFKFAWDALKRQKEVEELKAAVKDSELQFLTSQINPHFLFNNLNNLYAYAVENSPKTPDIIMELSSVLRYMLYECKEKYVPLSKEVRQLENFVKLNQLQIEERGNINFTCPERKSDYQIAPLILIVFIENAFKHSSASMSSDIQIDINIQLSEDGVLHFCCKNSFQPTTNTDKLSRGIGLQNVKKRLDLLYPDAHDLDIRESNNQYTVKLELQLKKGG